MKKVVHISTVHSPHDPRIFHKECKMLVAAGYDVYLVIPADHDLIRDGVKIVALKERPRFDRMVRGSCEALRRALSIGADIYHFHDPELIPAGLILCILGKKVVYDIHEEYVTNIFQKKYLPPRARKVVARLFQAFEDVAQRAFHLVLAERYYVERFPRGTVVCNYPLAGVFDGCHAIRNEANDLSGQIRVIYTGNITEDRGAFLHVALLTSSPRIHLTMVGRCSPMVAERIDAVLDDEQKSRLELVGVNEYVPFETIASYYQRGGWTAGLALFPPSPHYLQKELTKFFEYMAAGLPIVCSNFPTWQRLVEGNGVGVCVEPHDSDSVVKTLESLASAPSMCREMSERGVRLTRERFNWEVEGKKLLALYERSLIDP